MKFLNKISKVLLVCGVMTILGLSISNRVDIQAASVAITYNGSSHTNTSTRYKIQYEDKIVSKSGFEALSISSTYLMPYEDIIVDAMKYETTYDETTGIITIIHNDTTMEITVGTKKATVNGVAVTMPVKAYQVTFDKKNVTKIMLPIEFIATNLHLYCKKSGTTYIIKEPLKLVGDGVDPYYDGYRGTVELNKVKYTESDALIMKLNGYLQVSTTGLLGRVLGYDINYDPTTGDFSATDKNTSTTVTFKTGESTYSIKKGEEVKSYTLNVPIRLISVNENDPEPYINMTSFVKNLGLDYSWVSSEAVYYLHSKTYFDWTGDIKDDAIVNSIYNVKGSYELSNNVGVVDLRFVGDMQDPFDNITVDRTGKVITITLPNSSYISDLTSYARFGEIVNDMNIVSVDNIVTITINCVEVTEFSYTTANKTLDLRLIWDYSTETGKITNYSLSIPRPSGVFISSVSNTECYDAVNYNKRFKITIKGDYVSFFKEHPVIINNSSVKKVSVALNSNGNTVITVDTQTLQGYKIYRSDDYFVVSMNTPKKIYKNIIVLDAGHGGYDNGASYKGTREKDLNLKMIYTLMKGYVNKNAGDLHVYWTRRTDKYITLSTRAKFAAKCKADMFISLHMNSSGSKANGTEVYYSVSNNKKSFSSITSNKMATLMKNNLIKNLGTTNRGVKTAGFYVIKYNSVPSILVELAFINGSTDYKRLTNTTFQKKSTKTIYDTIVELFKKYPTGR